MLPPCDKAGAFFLYTAFLLSPVMRICVISVLMNRFVVNGYLTSIALMEETSLPYVSAVTMRPLGVRTTGKSAKYSS